MLWYVVIIVVVVVIRRRNETTKIKIKLRRKMPPPQPHSIEGTISSPIITDEHTRPTNYKFLKI